MDELITLLDFEKECFANIDEASWNYLATGAGDGRSVIANTNFLNEIQILPRVLKGHSHPDLSLDILGRKWEHPIGLAPVAAHGAYNIYGELETQEGAENSGTTLMLSTHSTYPIQKFAESTNYPWWFQLYIHRDRKITSELIDRAFELKAEAIVLTVDTPIAGYRDLDRKTFLGSSARLTPGQPDSSYPNLMDLVRYEDGRPKHMKVLDPVLDPSLTWKDLEWLISKSNLPVIVKGILHSEDAFKVKEMGASGLIVSNHGGRNLDGVVPAVRQISEIRDKVGSNYLIFADGGIRRGSDIFKAIGCGANAVLIGRPYIWGLSLFGSQGVQRIVEILRTELETTMILAGTSSLEKITKKFLV